MLHYIGAAVVTSVTQPPLVVTKQYRNFRLKGPIIPVFRWGPPGKSYLALCLQHPAEADASVWNTETSRTKTKHFSTGGKSALCAHLFCLPHLFSIYCRYRQCEAPWQGFSSSLHLYLRPWINPHQSKHFGQETGSWAAVNIFVWVLHHGGRRRKPK